MRHHKERKANALLGRIWSNRKRREIMDILSHPNPHHNRRCYFGGFLRYGVGLSVSEILEICDAYARWNDYERGITEYHLRHIGKENKTQRELRTFHRDEVHAASARFSSPQKLPKDAKRVVGIPSPNGFVLDWIKTEGKLG